MKNTKSRVMTLALLILSAAVLLAACAPKPAEPAATAVVTNAPAATAVVTDAPAATAVVTDAPAATAVATDAPAAAPAAEAALPVLTAEELAKYDGLDGNKAYVAFEGTVYDVSNAPQWASGVHGGNKAGTDITKNLKAAPHGTVKLDGLPAVGTLQALPVFTAEELAKYDGLDGNKAYVAFEGTVYDVSNAPQWVSGVHGGNKAGTDITKNLKAAPHGTAKLDGLPVVGTFTAP